MKYDGNLYLQERLRSKRLRIDLGKCNTHNELVAVLESYYLKYPEMLIHPIQELPSLLNALARFGPEGSAYYIRMTVLVLVKGVAFHEFEPVRLI